MTGESVEDELKKTQKEISADYLEKTSGNYVLDSVATKVIKIAQDGINAANSTTSYDEKINIMVKIVQQIVETVEDEKFILEEIEKKYKNQSDLIETLINKTVNKDIEL